MAGSHIAIPTTGAEYDKGGLAALYGHGSGGRPAGQLEFLVRRDYLQQYGQAIC